VRSFIDWILTDLEPSVFRGEPGHYARRIGGTEPDVYGVADLACILSTLGELHPTARERSAWEEAFASLQDEDGWYREREVSHLEVHATAFSVAALDLIGLRPARPLRFLERFRSRDGVAGWLDGYDWTAHTYLWSHEIAGVAGLASLLPETFEAGWISAWFAGLDARLDPVSGLIGRDKPACGDLDQVGGTFHHLFVYEHHRRRLPAGPARLDAVLGLQGADGLWDAANPLWLTLDGIYLLTRTVPQVPERWGDVTRAVDRAVGAVGWRLADAQARRELFGGDLGVHGVTAAVSLLAEAQRFLGADVVRAGRPLHLVLDRRPFV
jgi:hypothetical protein